MQDVTNQYEDELFLPDLCAIRMVFVVVIIAQLAAFVIALAPLNVSLDDRLNDLGMISLFVQWCALGSCSVLCFARRFLKRVNNIQAGFISYFLILLVVAIISELALQLVFSSQFDNASTWVWHFRSRNLAITALVAAPVLRYFYIQHQWRRNLRAESNARLQALQARIRPHFLFNSMNTIASLIPQQPDEAEEAVHNLADLFRASLNYKNKFITLQDEFSLCRQYLEIECLRLGERLKINWNIESLPEDALLPPLLIQPLLENAIYHGIEPILAGGTIQINGTFEKNSLLIEISNPLAEDASQQPSPRSSGHHIALDNIRERLDALYANLGTLSVEHNHDTYKVKLSFPYKNEYEDPNRR
jgi:two-component system sensor histidine kinase AlgZ